MEALLNIIHPPAKNLMAAVIDSSITPLLLLDGDLAAVAASATFCGRFGIEPLSVAGRRLAALGHGEWNIPELHVLLGATAAGFASIDAYEMNLEHPNRGRRCIVLHAHKLDYDDEDDVRVLVSVNDVTDARASDKMRDDLVREKGVLLQELQHRVANSLQMVASVLMQGARKVQSEEARGHLADAHTRVMSIAALQRQLTTSPIGEVELKPYFTALCDTIAASMIDDPGRISLLVHIDASVIAADASISLGLIVTELVINALKHAFPQPEQSGSIVVEYRTQGSAWALSVRDDGIGMPLASMDAPAGLGTNIVAALSKQLRAVVQIEDISPGSIIWIVGDHAVAPVGSSQFVRRARLSR